MQIVELVEMHKIIEGGSTRPILISAKNSNGIIKKFVVKLYKTDYINKNFSTAKEIFICELAKEFGVYTPNYAIINFDNRLLLKFYDEDYIKTLSTGYKFCSEFVEPTVLFNPRISNKFYDHYDCANIFAFDNIIFNSDRGGIRNKPNLLTCDENLILIDHEATLPFINNQTLELNYFRYLINYDYQTHTLFKYLNSVKEKNDFFNEFLEILTHFNPNKILAIFEFLQKYNIDFGSVNYYSEYLDWLKTKKDNIYLSLNRRFT